VAPLRRNAEHGSPEILEPLGKVTCPTYEVVLYVYRRRGGLLYADTVRKTAQEE
jgi:hypothetical protein